MSEDPKIEVIVPQLVEEPAPKRPQSTLRKTAKRIRIREEKFARGMVAHGDTSRAIYEAGYQPAQKNVSEVARQVASRPHVKARIDELLSEKYPDHERDFAHRLKEMLSLPLKASRDQSNEIGITVPEMTKLLEFIASMKGYHAPTKHSTLRANFQAKLPRE
jgi:hypothetical protein